MKNKKKKKGMNYTSMKCPYCGSTVEYRSAEGIYKVNHKNVMLYVCTNYPECDAYVRVHEGTNKPVGTLANSKLRAMRLEAHKLLNKIQDKGIMTKTNVISGLRIRLWRRFHKRILDILANIIVR